MTRFENVGKLATAMSSLTQFHATALLTTGSCQAGVSNGASEDEWSLKADALNAVADDIHGFAVWLAANAPALMDDEAVWPAYVPPS